MNELSLHVQCVRSPLTLGIRYYLIHGNALQNSSIVNSSILMLTEADRQIIAYLSKGPHLTVAGGISEARTSTRAMFESLGISTSVWVGDAHKFRESLQKSYSSKGFIVHVADPADVGASSQEVDTMHRLIWQQNWAASQKVPTMDFLSVTPSKGEVIQCLRLASKQWGSMGVRGTCVRVSYFATGSMIRLFDLLARKRSTDHDEHPGQQSSHRGGTVSSHGTELGGGGISSEREGWRAQASTHDSSRAARTSSAIVSARLDSSRRARPTWVRVG